MKNTLSDVHNHMMVQLEALSEESLQGDALDAAILRAKASCGIAGAITANARLVLDAYEAQAEAMGSRAGPPPAMLITHDE